MIPLLLALLLPAEAHRPAPLVQTTTVADPTISWVLAGAFATGEETFIVEMSFEQPIALPFEVLVPLRDKYADHRPRFALVGPGLPAPTDDQRALLPFEVPDGAGVFIELNDDADRFVYFEGVMRRTMWSSGTIAVPLAAGDYEAWIWSPGQSPGDFQFAFGVEEDFSDGGFSDLFAEWGRYAW